MHSYMHHVNKAFNELFPCEFTVSPEYWGNNNPNVEATYISQCGSSHGYVARALTTSGVAQCGGVHMSPNVPKDIETTIVDPRYGNWDYDGPYHPELKFKTGCDDWQPDPALLQPNAQNILDCRDQTRAWGCTGQAEADRLRYNTWWMQNAPGFNNVIKHCDGTTPLGNW
jgi:hypothetical protein